ncbi:MAG: cupin domain-containing protein [Deltaproteobacteria bacterium]|jgi:quercetin dioxygenase-like cupin family protein|nr:cupin domain-containing protein [Deltaproteobacteria bacterium]
MKKISLALLTLAIFIAISLTSESRETMRQIIFKSGDQASVNGSPDYFTGRVKVDPLFPANEVSPISGAYVTFEPGARSHWHTHPAGQRLVVISGIGRTGTVDGGTREIKPGDVVWCPPNIKHWHGAGPEAAMTHMALTGTLDGQNVVWMEPVTDETYNNFAPKGQP